MNDSSFFSVISSSSPSSSLRFSLPFSLLIFFFSLFTSFLLSPKLKDAARPEPNGTDYCIEAVRLIDMRIDTLPGCVVVNDHLIGLVGKET